MSPIKTPQEMARIREIQGKLNEEARKHFVPEKNEAKPMAYFEVSRYVTGSFRGLFVAAQLIDEDANGRPLARPIRKVVADGVDMVVCMAAIETALRKRVFR